MPVHNGWSTMVGAGKNVQALVVIDIGAGTVPPAPTIVTIDVQPPISRLVVKKGQHYNVENAES